MKLALKTIGIVIFSISVLVSFGLTSNQAFAGIGDNGELTPIQPVGGLANPVPDSELYAELATQYSLWLIPTLSAVGIGAYIIKRKF